MPGPLDMLKRGFNMATTPLIDKETVDPYANAVDVPRLNKPHFDPSSMLGKAESFGQGAQARLGGFGAGAMEGMRGMTSPLDIAGALFPAIKGLRVGAGAAKAAGRLAPTLDLVEGPIIKQVAPAADDVADLIGDMQRNMARVPTSKAKQAGRFVEEVQSDWHGPNAAPVAETLGERAAEFTPVGGEAIYNAGRGATQSSDAMESLYQHLMRTMGGRGR